MDFIQTKQSSHTCLWLLFLNIALVKCLKITNLVIFIISKCLFIHSTVNGYMVISSLEHLGIMLLWSFLTCLSVDMCISVNAYLGMKSLSNKVRVYSTLIDTASFTKWYRFILLTDLFKSSGGSPYLLIFDVISFF